MSNQIENRPRDYAEEIIHLPTKEERQTALKEIPEHLQKIVKIHVANAFMLRKYARESQS